MWAAIFISLFIAAGAGFIYLITRFRKFNIVKKLAGNRRWFALLIGFCITAVAFVVMMFSMNIMNAMICMLHLVLFWLLCDFAGWIAGKCTKRTWKIYYPGICAIVITIAYLSMGYYIAHHVKETDYKLKTDKELAQGGLKIVEIADSHVGTTFDGEGFAKYMKEIEKVNPDVLFIAGDFVDDDTKREDMIRCCQALGELKTTYGVYYVFGNHDKGYYQNYRDFDANDLVSELEKNHVTVLQDEAVLVADSFYIVGRQDASIENRADAVTLTEPLDKSKYIIMLDHQPVDYDMEAASGADLVLSGHTHGGQLIPITYAGEWMGVNDSTYGYKQKEQTEFIVTSGISDWSIKFKTGCKSEYVVIDVTDN